VSSIKINLLPAQIDQLRYPQPVSVAHQNQRRVAMSPAPFESNLDHRLHFLLKQILPIANFQIFPSIAASFLRRGIRLFSFQKSPAGGELDDSHATPKSSLNILRYGWILEGLSPSPERDRHRENFSGSTPGRNFGLPAINLLISFLPSPKAAPGVLAITFQ
jgi:hypothetical protein